MSTTATSAECRWCGQAHGPQCPHVKAIEFNPDGSVKRVEFKTAADYGPVILPGGVWPTYPPPRSWEPTCDTPLTITWGSA